MKTKVSTIEDYSNIMDSQSQDLVGASGSPSEVPNDPGYDESTESFFLSSSMCSSSKWREKKAPEWTIVNVYNEQKMSETWHIASRASVFESLQAPTCAPQSVSRASYARR